MIPPGSKRMSPAAARNGPRRSPGSRIDAIVEFARLYGGTKRSLYPARLRLFAAPQRLDAGIRGDLPAGGDRRLAI